MKNPFINICLGLIRGFINIAFRPKALYVNKQIQSRKFKEPAIIVANHTAYWDPVFILSVLRGKTTIVIAKDKYEKKAVHWIAKGIHAVPVDRFNMDTDWIMAAKNAVKDGYSVIIFPEGKTRRDGELNEFKSGFAFLAKITGAPVVPVGLEGVYKFGRRCHYVIGTPEKITRTPGVPSSQDLSDKSELFRQKVYSYKKCAIEGKLNPQLLENR